jgi:hypothetical protein
VIITEQTTLGELAAERARLGVSALTIRRKHNGRRLAVACDASYNMHDGTGDTDAEAIAIAFASVERATLPSPSPLSPVTRDMVEAIDHNGESFTVVILGGQGNPDKPVYLCGCGRGIRVGQSLIACRDRPVPSTLLGVEP